MIRYLFDSPQAAAMALSVVLRHARTSEDDFTFGGLTLESLVSSGLWLTGDVSAVQKRLDAVPGAVLQNPIGR